MRRLGVPVLIFMFLLLLVGVGRCATYYVCDDGTGCGGGWDTGVDTNDGSQKTDAGGGVGPWKTIQKAEDNVSAGDTVIVGDGTYDSFEIAVAGTSASWITFKGENLHGSTIDEAITTNKGAGPNGINVYRTEYIRIENFEIIRCLVGVAVRGIPGNQSHDIYLYRLKVHNVGRGYTDSGCDDGGTAPWAGIYTQPCTQNVTIDSCEVYDIGRVHNSCCNPTYIPASDTFYDHNIYLCGDQHIVKNCLLYKAYSGWPLKLFWSSFTPTGSFAHKIINNTFGHPTNDNYSTGCDGRSPVGHIQLANTDLNNTVIRNNVFYDPPGTYVMWQGSGDLANISSFEYNVTSVANWNYQYGGSGSLSVSNCTTSLATAGFKMVDPTNDDFDITDNTSPLIDGGSTTEAPDYDHAGTIRPYDDGYDVGAYEYDGGSAPPGGDITVTPSPAANDDDGYKRETTGDWASEGGNEYIAFGYTGVPEHYSAHIRFQLNVPNAATITAATVTGTARVNNADGTVADIYAEDVDDSAQINNVGEYNAAVAQLTTATVEWDLPATVATTAYTSPDIKTIIQEVVDRGGWAANQYIQLFFVDTASTTFFEPYCFEKGSSLPMLSVTYDSGAGPTISSVYSATSGTVTSGSITIDLNTSGECYITGNPTEIPSLVTNTITADGTTRYWTYTSKTSAKMIGTVDLVGGDRTPVATALDTSGDLLLNGCTVKDGDGDNITLTIPAWVSGITVEVPGNIELGIGGDRATFTAFDAASYSIDNDTFDLVSDVTDNMSTDAAGTSGNTKTLRGNNFTLTGTGTFAHEYWDFQGVRFDGSTTFSGGNQTLTRCHFLP